MGGTHLASLLSCFAAIVGKWVECVLDERRGGVNNTVINTVVNTVTFHNEYEKVNTKRCQFWVVFS